MQRYERGCPHAHQRSEAPSQRGAADESQDAGAPPSVPAGRDGAIAAQAPTADADNDADEEVAELLPPSGALVGVPHASPRAPQSMRTS